MQENRHMCEQLRAPPPRPPPPELLQKWAVHLIDDTSKTNQQAGLIVCKSHNSCSKEVQNSTKLAENG